MDNLNLHLVLLNSAKCILANQPAENRKGICSVISEAANQIAYNHRCDQKFNPVFAKKVMQVRDQLTDYVQGLLGYHDWLAEWLVTHRYATKIELRTPEGKEKLKRTRLAWIDHLIQEFKTPNPPSS